MAKMLWYHFCEHHSTDASGKNSYIAVFDNMSISLRPVDRTKKHSFPLPRPIQSQPFVLAVGLLAQPGVREEFKVEIVDTDGQSVIPPMTGKLTAHPEGRHTCHMNFARGIPLVRSGIYTFRISVGGTQVGEAVLPISIEIDEEEP